MKFVIVTGGHPPTMQLLQKHLLDAHTLIGVDGAADLLTHFGIIADILIGDFDTADEKSVISQQESGAVVLRLAEQKSETDTEAAVNYAIEHDATQIVMLGALGTRADHTQSNIMLLVRASEANVDAKIIDENNELFVCNSSVTIEGTSGQTISIMPLTGNITVNAEGLYYPLINLLLRFGSSRGISNVTTSDTSQITVSGAYALIVIANAKE